MKPHDFSSLFSAYPAVIAAMPAQFTSHEFIRELARRQQVLYIEALYDYRTALRAGKPAPFMMVHGILAQQLKEFPHLIRMVASAVSSTDIFGTSNTAALWQKVAAKPSADGE